MPRESLDLVGHSQPISAVRAQIAAAAAAHGSVCLTGEPGTGKELVARIIHHASRRRHHPLVALQCEGLPENLLHSEILGHAQKSFPGAYRDKRGLVHRAQNGGILLKGLGPVGPGLGQALHRLARTGDVYAIGNSEPVARVDVRLMLTSSHARPSSMLRDGREVIEIEVPPLRTRTDDIEVLARHFLKRMAEVWDRPCPVLHPDAVTRLLEYQWPGNVRELQEVLAAAFLSHRGDVITATHLPVIG